MCLSSTPSCHHTHFHCDLLISHSVSHSACGCPDAWLTWFNLFNITGPGQQWKNSGHTPNPAWHISHQIWVLAASIVFNWSVGWLISKPAVNPWPPKQGDAAFFLLCQCLLYCCCWPSPYYLSFFLSVFLSLLLSAMQGTKSPDPNSHFTNNKLCFWLSAVHLPRTVGGQDVPLKVCFLCPPALMMQSRTQNLAGYWLVQSCPNHRRAALTSCAKLWPNCAYSRLGSVLYTWMFSPQGVVKGSLHLAREWMDIGVQPKPN